MRRLNRKNYIFAFLAICWMAVIFMFSQKPADDSTEDSNLVSRIILRAAVPDFEAQTPEAQAAMLGRIEVPVRKGAHMTEYAVLAALLLGAVLPSSQASGIYTENVDAGKAHAQKYPGIASGNRQKRGGTGSTQTLLSAAFNSSGHIWTKSALFSLGLSVLYACTDEIHQTFVPGRAGMLTDVLIDGGGALIGLGAVRFFRHLIRRFAKPLS